MNAQVPNSTGYEDKNGVIIHAGDIVRNIEGFEGKVVFQNCSWRYDIGRRLLSHNSSLLYGEGDVKPKNFEVLR